uniref:Deoxyhypusine hydroxylase n=1 Tax=Ciona intestinalis TaxID=7719 RepID=H2Y0R7_CIOIN
WLCFLLSNTNAKLSDRYRALFMLKNIGGKDAVTEISRCLVDKSELLNHELAYCLGQINSDHALPKLSAILKNKNLSTILRHEAAEAIGAIGSLESLSLLQDYTADPVREVAETCQLAVTRVKWLNSSDSKEPVIPNPFSSIDPAPAGSADNRNISSLQEMLVNTELSLFDRYRAMFSLRNINSNESATALAVGLQCSDSALFRHEVAYVLGQMQKSNTVPQLTASLSDLHENCMVRHECAEALGSIATGDCLKTLEEFKRDENTVVRESCEVALDMLEYENSSECFRILFLQCFQIILTS